MDPEYVADLLQITDDANRDLDRELSERSIPGRLDRLFENCREKLRRGSGEWVSWSVLRPAYRDRQIWGERVWALLVADPLVETAEEQCGLQLRRKARWIAA